MAAQDIEQRVSKDEYLDASGKEDCIS